jgi:hypothetical protein
MFHRLDVVGYVELGGVCRGVAINGAYAYVGKYEHGLSMVDISNPHSPSEVVTLQTEGFPKDVEVAGHFAYVADSGSHDSGPPWATLRVFDIADPLEVREVGALTTGGEGDGVELMGRYALFEHDPNYLLVVDISDPAFPRESGVYDFGDGVRNSTDLAVSGHYAFLAVPDTGLHVIDLSDPASPRPVSIVDDFTAASSVAVEGGYAYVGDDTFQPLGGTRSKVAVLDVSAPSRPRKVGEYVFAELDTRAPSSIRVLGSYAYATGAPSGWVHVFDVSEPTRPRRIVAQRVSGEASKLAVRGQYLYVSTGAWLGGTGKGGLHVLRHSVISPETAYFPAVVIGAVRGH